MNEMITCNRNAPSTRLTIPIGSQNPDVGPFLSDPLPWLWYWWHILSAAARCCQDTAATGC